MEIKVEMKPVNLQNLTDEERCGALAIATMKARYCISFYVNQECFEKIESKIMSIQSSIYYFVFASLVGDFSSMEFTKKNISIDLDDLIKSHEEFAEKVRSENNTGKH